MEKVKSRFGFSNNSVAVRGEKSKTAELILTSTHDKVKLTAKASLALGIGNGDNLWFISNIKDMEAAVAKKELTATNNPIVFIDNETNEEITAAFLVTKGIPVFDRNGNPVMTKDRATKEEVQAVYGCKMANVSGREGVGMSLEGSDANNYRLLGGNSEVNKVFSINLEEPIEVEMFGKTITAYAIEFKEDTAKIERKKK